MKRRLLSIVLAMCLIGAAGCGGQETGETESETQAVTESVAAETESETEELKTVKSVIEKLKSSGIPIVYDIIYTDETDPNGPDGRDYLEKGNFADSRIETEYSKDEPQSGSIEIFESKEKAEDRADYLESLDFLDSFANRLISDNILIRLSKDYSDEQIDQFVDILKANIHSKSEKDGDDTAKVLDEIIDEAKSETEVAETEQKSTSYSGGMYKIGTDMPAGEYLITTTSSYAYMQVSSDSSGELGSIVTNDNYSNRIYITVDDGQYLQFDGTAVPASEAPAYEPENGAYEDGVYLVGKDIPAGEYKVSVSSSALGMGYIEVSSDSSGGIGSIITNDNIENDTYQTVQDGQYLKLVGATITIQ